MSKESEQNNELEENAEFYVLRLYVAGQTPKSLQVFENLKKSLSNI